MTSSLVSAMRSTTAGRGASSSQHQPQRHVRRGASLAAATQNQPQDWSASCRAGFVFTVHDTWLGGALRGSVCQHRISHWLPFSSLATDRRMASTSLMVIRRNSPAARHSAERGAFIQYDHHGSRRSVVHSTPCQQISRRLADMVHSSSLSSSAVSVGIDPNENGLTHAQASFAPGAKTND